jgi:hypothetical protein
MNILPSWHLPRDALACMGVVLMLLVASAAAQADPAVLAYGLGLQRMPSWVGAGSQHDEPLPYVDIEIPGRGSFSTLDGLRIELLHGSTLRGGIYGGYQWGRSREDLGALANVVSPLVPRVNAGGYLEWELGTTRDAGFELSHDINGAGAYLKLYLDQTLPSIGHYQHDFTLSLNAQNGSAMRRLFGMSPTSAAAPGAMSWQSHTGVEQVDLEYDAYLPVSRHTGLALALIYARLLGGAASSPLVRNYGSVIQRTVALAFVYHP